MSITMSTKKSRKNNFENVSPTGHKKKLKNIVNAEDENNVTHKSLKKKENVDVMQVKVGRKRKQTDADIETPTPKKIRRKNKEQTTIEEVLSLPSSTNNFDAKEIKISATPPKRTKKKTKIFDADKQAFHIVTEQNNTSVNVGEIPIQQNGKRKERDKSNQGGTPGQETSFNNINDALICKDEVDYNNIINDIAMKDNSLRNDKVVNVTVQDLVETDSDLNNEIFAELEKKIDKTENPKVAKVKETINWPKEDLKKLVDRMETCIPDNDVLAFGTRAEKLEWGAVAFKNYTADDCKKTWFLLQKQIRRFRLLKEVLVDAKQWIITPQSKSKKPGRHPDMPRKPLTAYFIYYLKKRDVYHQTHPGLDATEISKILGQEFKSLSAEKKLKYEKLAAKKREEYEQELEKFYKTHPDVPRIVKLQKIRPEKPPKPEKIPKPPKPPKPVKEKPPPKPPKERIPKRPHPPFQYYFLSELEKQSGETEDKIAFKEVCKERWKEMNDKKKLVWINYAEVEYAKYEEAIKQYLQSHPDFVHTPHKPTLSKEEIQIKERAAGKPSKPPGSAYNLYARMLLQSDEIKAIPVKDRLIYVSNQWKNCVEEEKKQYRELSTKLNEKYKLDFASYLETLPEEERKLELQKTLPRQRKSEEKEKKVVTPKKKKPERTERKTVAKKVVEPEQPPISAFKYFATLYTGEEPVAKAWKALNAEQKKIYEDELVKKKQAYIADFEKFLKSLSKEELEAFSNSRNRINKQEDDEDEEETSDESGTEDSETESNDQDDDEEDEDK